ncbi:MAG: hypothetical protein H6813_03810 [Phycisphaeraceae bacterium]|nr:hypothetical protein [Phycisphaeraceae bacterium]
MLDITLVVLIASVLIGGVMWSRAERREVSAIEGTRSALSQLEREIRLRSGTGNAELNARGWPVRVEASWFQGEAPRNLLLSDDHPWMEIAPPADAMLEHPRTRIAIDRSTASFWYNPANGIIRARTPAGVSDKRTTEVYNEVNSTSLSSIFGDMGVPGQPILAIGGREEPREQTALVGELDDSMFGPVEHAPQRN